MVIAIASSMEERARLAGALDGSVVLLVSSPAEALEVLSGAVSGTPAPVGVPVPRGASRVSVVQQAKPGFAAPTRLPVRSASGLEVDSDWRVARCADREVRLTPLEHDLLVCLLDGDGHIETFESLQRRVWGNDHLGGRSHVQSVVKRLRRKLAELSSPLQIDAVRGVGLRLVGVDTPRHRTVDRIPAPGRSVTSTP